MKTALALAAALTLSPIAGQAQTPPQPAPPERPIPPSKDVAYPGVIRLSVEATDLEHRIFRIKETVPVAKAGRLTLLYPQWLPGNHSPSGQIEKLGGLKATAGGKRLDWVRDLDNVYAFHVEVPAGVKAVDLEFQFLSATDARQGRVVVTPEMLNLQWNSVVLYPAGYFARRIMVEADMTLPDGWGFGSALEVASRSGAKTQFKPAPLETLVDSPIFAGRYFRQFDLDPGGRSPVRLNVVADSPEKLEAKPEQIEAHRQLVKQADALFGARHYDHYDFLLSLTDRMGGIGLEHHRSSENGVDPSYFTDWDKKAIERDLLPHEYTHSWNGKFRRPFDLWTPEYRTPMRDSLLWVYEGQTQYWGYVLGARSGLLTKQQALDAIAMTAATFDARVGREWRALQDTTNDPIIAQRRPLPWVSWQRSEDYYSEGELIWLDADTLIRERSKGARSLDDVAKAFFGVEDGSFVPLTYRFDDVVKALNAVEPYDWATFLRTRLDGHGPGAPLDGLQRGGYRLVFTDTPTDYFKAAEDAGERKDHTYSLGFTVNKDGELTGVRWDGPAFKAGLTIGTKLIAVDGLAYSADRLKDAIAATKAGPGGVELLVRSGDRIRTVKIAYQGGLRYPRLERVAGSEARLDAILAPKN